VLRKLWVYSVAFAWVGVLFLICAPLVVLWPSLAWRNRLSLWAGASWAKVALWASGIRVELSGLEHLAHRPAIFTFNHTNILDFFANAFYADRRCLVFGKRELVRLPFVGWGWWLGGHPMLYRDDPGRWKQQLDRVQGLLQAGYSTIVAPEGKRSKDGRLLPFKKGPFHLALDSGLPVVPVVIRGAGEALVRGVPQPGTTLRVEALPPIPTSGWRRETIDDHVTEVRQVYLRALGQSDPESAVPATQAPSTDPSER
jgi:1-acyl-sn-glycerol-3-phosphate acyltransferase